MRKQIRYSLIGLLIFIVTVSFIKQINGNTNNRMVRIAKIKVDPKQLQAYNAALQIQMQTAIEREPGVLSYYAVADKQDPSSITILEMYADTIAYKKHTTAPHFLAYKETVKNMVLALELQDVTVIAAAKKPGM